jgi:hypothetical protein
MPDLALKMYRRGSRYLKAYREFELLRLVVVSLSSTRCGKALTNFGIG